MPRGNLLILALLSMTLSGCLAAAGAAVGGGIVYAVTEDTARVDIRADQIAVMTSVEQILESKGEVTSSLRRAGYAEANVGNSEVEVRVFPVEEFVRVRVKARRVGGVFPNLELAQEIAGEVRRAFP